ncbi:hypothetical protein V8D89_001014 [Ganoderma adspersum]
MVPPTACWQTVLHISNDKREASSPAHDVKIELEQALENDGMLLTIKAHWNVNLSARHESDPNCAGAPHKAIPSWTWTECIPWELRRRSHHAIVFETERSGRLALYLCLDFATSEEDVYFDGPH